MYIKTIELNNWVCYKGRHTLNLEPLVYSVTARGEHDSQRSNWLGKSTLLNAIPFALFGEHKFDREDMWVTRGQSRGGVSLVLDNGVVIHRYREKSTTVEVEVDGVSSKGEVAQHIINKIIGMTKDDFYSTCFFEQKKMAKFILADPSERMNMVKAWLSLHKLDDAQEYALTAAKIEQNAIDIRVNSLSYSQGIIENGLQTLTDIIGVVVHDNTFEKITNQYMVSINEKIDIIRGQLANADNSQYFVEYNEHNRNASQLEDLIEKGTRLKRLLVSSEDIAKNEEESKNKQSRWFASINDVDAKKREHRYRLSLFNGGFDGVCPVMKKDCPAKDIVSNEVKNIQSQCEAAKVDLNNAIAQMESFETEWRNFDSELNRMKMNVTQYNDCKQAYTKALESKKWLQCHSKPEQSNVLHLSNELVRLTRLKQHIETTVKTITTQLDNCKVFNDAIEKCKIQLDQYSLIAASLGPGGAQRKAAESALSTIEIHTNALLQGIGIDLSSTISWFTEGKKLSSHCEECGYTFPTSQTMKVCPQCKTLRGPSRRYRLTVDLSSRSGAAEDLVGAAYQLAVSSWLRAQRQVNWGVVTLDEPFGALDHANKTVFSTHIATMLKSQYGFEQAFVVAHDKSIMESYPGQILITGSSGTSKVEVM